jgi:hypothetical protein
MISTTSLWEWTPTMGGEHCADMAGHARSSWSRMGGSFAQNTPFVPFDKANPRGFAKRTRGDEDDDDDDDDDDGDVDLVGACQALLGRCSAEIDSAAATGRDGKRRRVGGWVGDRSPFPRHDTVASPWLEQQDGMPEHALDSTSVSGGEYAMMEEEWGGEANAAVIDAAAAAADDDDDADDAETTLMGIDDDADADVREGVVVEPPTTASWSSVGSPPWGRPADSASRSVFGHGESWPRRLDSDGNPFALAPTRTVELSSELSRLLAKLGLQWYVQPDGTLLANGGVEISELALSRLRVKMDADGVIRIQTTNDAGDTMLVEGTLSPGAHRASGGGEGAAYQLNIKVSLLYQWPRRIEAIEAAPRPLALPAPRGWLLHEDAATSCHSSSAGVAKRGWGHVDGEEEDDEDAPSPERSTSPWRPVKKLRSHAPSQGFAYGRARLATDEDDDDDMDEQMDARRGKRGRF